MTLVHKNGKVKFMSAYTARFTHIELCFLNQLLFEAGKSKLNLKSFLAVSGHIPAADVELHEHFSTGMLG